jgi:hypothetical protein
LDLTVKKEQVEVKLGKIKLKKTQKKVKKGGEFDL